MNTAKRRIAQINLRTVLNEGVTIPSMASQLREFRSQLLDQKRVWAADSPQNDTLADAVNGLSDTLLALAEWEQLKTR